MLIFICAVIAPESFLCLFKDLFWSSFLYQGIHGGEIRGGAMCGGVFESHSNHGCKKTPAEMVRNCKIHQLSLNIRQLIAVGSGYEVHGDIKCVCFILFFLMNDFI